jgi:hypothetical protein
MTVDLHGCEIATTPDEGPVVYTYVVGGPNPTAVAPPPDPKKSAPAKGKDAPPPVSPRTEIYKQNGSDFVENIISNWIDYEFISVEDPSHGSDIETLRLLKTVYLLKICYAHCTMSNVLNYFLRE